VTASAGPVRADTVTIEAEQTGGLRTHSVFTVTPDVAAPGDTIQIEGSSSFILTEIPCGVPYTSNIDVRQDFQFDFYSAVGPGPTGDQDSLTPDPTSLFSLIGQRSGSDVVEQVGACEARYTLVTHSEVTLPSAEELRALGAKDGPVRIMMPIQRLGDASTPVTFLSGDLPQITLRAITSDTSATTAPAEGNSLTADSQRTLVDSVPEAGTVLGLFLGALLLALLSRGPRKSPRLEHLISLALRLISAGLFVQQMVSGDLHLAILVANVGLFGLSFAPRRLRSRVPDGETLTDEVVGGGRPES
jgi:hypothetical protein